MLVGHKLHGVKRISGRAVVAAGGDGRINRANGADAFDALYAGKPVLCLLGLKFLTYVLKHVFTHTYLGLFAASMPNQHHAVFVWQRFDLCGQRMGKPLRKQAWIDVFAHGVLPQLGFFGAGVA